MLSPLEQQIRTQLKHNITAGLWDGGLFGVALGFASFGTILPRFIGFADNRDLFYVTRKEDAQ